MRTFVMAAAAVLASWSAHAMQLTSPDIANGAPLARAQVHSRCGGQNQSPALVWSGAPAGTKSFALTLFDPDAGGGRGFWHWLVFDIPASTMSLPAGAGSGQGLPAGAKQAENDFGEAGFGGACPPPGSGVHHYEFTLYALGSTASAPANANASDLAAFLKSHALTTAGLMATYQR